jgi:uncharacterized membrane protein YcaP (DUF421 family)
MSDMIRLSLPWWEFALRGAIAYIALLLLMRLAGKHAFGEMSAFDIVVLIIIGSAMRPALTGGDKSILGPFIAVSAILLLDKIVAVACARHALLNRFVQGRAVLLARDGRSLPEVLRRHEIPQSGFNSALRQHGIADIGEVREAHLEPNGKISFLKRTAESA